VTGERAERQIRTAELVARAGGDVLTARDELHAEIAGLVARLQERAETDETLRLALQRAAEVLEAVGGAAEGHDPQSTGQAWFDLWVLLPFGDSLWEAVSDLEPLPESPSPVPVSERAAVLATMPDTVALEVHLARSPIWQGSRAAMTQLALWRHVGSLNGRPFRLLTPLGPRTVRDALLLAHLTRRYAEDDFPEDRRIRFSLNEGARWQGYSTEGGKQRQLVRGALGRLRASTFEHLAHFPDGHEETLTWGILDLGRTTTRDGGRAVAVVSEPLADLIRGGSLTYLNAPTFRELLDRDELAARLWLFLETESYPHPMRYAFYSASEGDPEADRHTPAVADLLRLSDWTRRRDAVQRVRKAAAVVSDVEPRYRLGVERAKRGRGMWNLNVSVDASQRRSRGVPGVAHGGTGSRAWGYRESRSRARKGGVPSVSPSVLTVEYGETLSANAETRALSPSKSKRRRARRDEPPDVAALLERWPRVTGGQRRSLEEIAERHDVTGRAWAEAIIRATPEGEDPFRAVMDADKAWQQERRVEIEATETAWEVDKEAEAEGARTLAETLAEHGATLPGWLPSPEPEEE